MLGIKFIGISRLQDIKCSLILWKRKKLPPEKFYCWTVCYTVLGLLLTLAHFMLETPRFCSASPYAKTKNNLYSYIQLSRKKKLTETMSYAFIHKPANQCTQPTWKNQNELSVHSQSSCTENCALERRFPEERVRPSFPARPKSGLISIALWQFALAGYPAHRSEVAAGAHRPCSSHCPSETQWMLGVTATKIPLLSWHGQASSFSGNSRHWLRCELQSAYPPKNVVPVGLTSPITWGTAKEGGYPEENSQQIFSHQRYRAQRSLLQRRWGAVHNLQLSWGV